jgi:hypothetical protein
MSRLLFAAARGARIEWQTLSGKWHPAVSLTDVRSEGGQDAYRIHPDYAHLAYGPISTDIHDMDSDDLHNDDMPHLALASACVCGIDGTWSRDWRKQSVGDRATAMLILAEALADEGL